MGVLGELKKIQDQLFDPQTNLLRLAPGVTPGHDLSALNLHSVRETALSAYADLRDGNVDRARAQLRAVLASQWLEPGAPWHGTFPTVAEQPVPREGAKEWVDYDPNWRQFVGVALVQCRNEFTSLVGDELTAAIDAALRACVEGEPRERIPVWYTNPLLLAAWLEATVGVVLDEPGFVNRGEERLRSVSDQVDRDSDLAEYNSPTYDGINLFALALCEQRPPTPVFAELGRRLSETLKNRLHYVWTPTLGAIAGPYIRTYGFRLTDYVSLTGLWWAIAGAGMNTLPAVLDVNTDHVHDLFFAPLFDDLAPTWRIPNFRGAGMFTRRLGPVTATSCSTEFALTGLEVGRHHTFARDQYFPIVAHQRHGGVTSYLALNISDSVTVSEGFIGYDARIFATLFSEGSKVTCVMRSSHPPQLDGDGLTSGGITVAVGIAPDVMETTAAAQGYSTRLEWPAKELPIQVLVDAFQ